MPGRLTESSSMEISIKDGTRKMSGSDCQREVLNCDKLTCQLFKRVKKHRISACGKYRFLHNTKYFSVIDHAKCIYFDSRTVVQIFL
jgi:hypothetical protein